MKPTVKVIAEPRPEGEKIIKAVIRLNGTECDAAQITVNDRTITGRTIDGDTVVLQLSEADEKAFVIAKPAFRTAAGQSGAPGQPGGNLQPGGPAPGTQRPRLPERKRGSIEVTVNIPGVGEVVSSEKCEGIIDCFTQHEYKDFLYNFFIPQLKDGEKYPLIVFIPDASPNGSDPLMALSQGIGATVWVEPENQAKHPCYVLAIQVPRSIHLTNDQFEVPPEFDQIKELIDKISSENAVDTDRIYMTGQSQGCMSTFEMNIRHPDFLAASLCVSGQWDSVKVGKLSKNKFFMGLSEGGLKEYPGMRKICDELEKNGAEVSRFHVNYRDGWDTINSQIREKAGNANVVMCAFDRATAWDDEESNHRPIEHHNRGWELTYQSEAVRDWIFSQSRQDGK